MATLAQIFDRFNTRTPGEAPQLAAADNSEAFRLRMFPNEDVYFFVKRIDNSRIVRESDPKARRTCWSVIGGACAVAVFLTGLLLPSVQSLLAGYKIEALRETKHRLELESANLEYQETTLLTTTRLHELAEKQKFVDGSTPQKFIYLDARSDGTLARVNATPAVIDAKQ
jgi:hypothetical protein